jgi:adenylosuccinate lyase
VTEQERQLGLEQEQSYRNPLTERYASAEMSRIFSAAYKFTTWRRLWLALAAAEAELGLPISDAALADMQANLDSIDLNRANELERRFRHDVMATCITSVKWRRPRAA